MLYYVTLTCDKLKESVLDLSKEICVFDRDSSVGNRFHSFRENYFRTCDFNAYTIQSLTSMKPEKKKFHQDHNTIFPKKNPPLDIHFVTLSIEIDQNNQHIVVHSAFQTGCNIEFNPYLTIKNSAFYQRVLDLLPSHSSTRKMSQLLGPTDFFEILVNWDYNEAKKSEFEKCLDNYIRFLTDFTQKNVKDFNSALFSDLTEKRKGLSAIITKIEKQEISYLGPVNTLKYYQKLDCVSQSLDIKLRDVKKHLVAMESEKKKARSSELEADLACFDDEPQANNSGSSYSA